MHVNNAALVAKSTSRLPLGPPSSPFIIFIQTHIKSDGCINTVYQT